MYFLTIFTGTSLLRRLYESVAEARVHRAQHIEFSKTFSEDNIARWTEMVRVWNDSPKTAPNPYEEPVLGMSSSIFIIQLSKSDIIALTGTSLADVKRELNKEEDEELKNGVLPLHQMSAAQFLATGLELEEQQYVKTFL